jgi:hypothetical protein
MLETALPLTPELWRKGSFRSDSEAGTRFGERLLTLVASCRQQGRPLLDFLVGAVEAALRGSQPPPLLPAAGGAERLLFPYVGISGCPCWIRKNRCADCQPVDSQEAPRAL